MDPNSSSTSDVVVVGGGLAGLASAIHLSRAGLKVICLEPKERFDHIVGESLDWSAPELFKQLGFGMEDLVERGVATFKRHVILQLRDGSRAEYIPSEWLAKPPLNVELKTLHLDRVRLHCEMQEAAQAAGVVFVREAAASVERSGNRIHAVVTNAGNRYAARWFVDASGYAASFLGRQLKLPYIAHGPKKVAIWAYANVDEWQEGTTLYSANRDDEYFSWIWEIPVAPGRMSLGFVTTGENVKQERAKGLSTDEILRQQLGRHAKFDAVMSNGTLEPANVRSYQCRVCRTACGPNWVMAGESAAVPDPITGNGVTAALRHAAEGSRLILRSLHRRTISWYARTLYNWRLTHMVKFFNDLIERLAYAPRLRNRFGLLRTGDVYTALAWSMNHLYSRFGPNGILGSGVFCGSMMGIRALAWFVDQFVRIVQRRPQLVLQGAH